MRAGTNPWVQDLSSAQGHCPYSTGINTWSPQRHLDTNPSMGSHPAIPHLISSGKPGTQIHPWDPILPGFHSPPDQQQLWHTWDTNPPMESIHGIPSCLDPTPHLISSGKLGTQIHPWDPSLGSMGLPGSYSPHDQQQLWHTWDTNSPMGSMGLPGSHSPPDQLRQTWTQIHPWNPILPESLDPAWIPLPRTILESDRSSWQGQAKQRSKHPALLPALP